MSSGEKESLSRWLVIGVLWCLALGICGVLILHLSLMRPLRTAVEAVATADLLLLAWYVSMFWIRARFKRTHDYRSGAIVFAVFISVLGVIGMKYAEQLGFVARGTAAANYYGFLILMAIAAFVDVVFFSLWRRRTKV